MWQILKTLFIQGVLAKVLLRAFGWLGWLLPIGFLLKAIGWPILVVLGILAAPVIILLLIVGLPIFVVLMVGTLLMSVVGFVLTIGIALAKILIPIALVVWLVRWLLKDRGSEAAPATPAAAAEGPAAS